MKLPHVDIVKYRNWWFGISLAITLPGVVGVFLCLSAFHAPLKPGIDFTGGSIIQYDLGRDVKLDGIRSVVEETIPGSQVQDAEISGKRVLVIRTKALDDQQKDEALKKKLTEALKTQVGNDPRSVDTVSGIVGPELLQNGLMSLFLTFGAMVLYIKFRFMFDYALCAIAALFHDVLVLVGIFALLGYYHGTEVDSLFISAVLTVIGFSVHDTIVVFDRIRENAKFVGSKGVDKNGKEYRKTFGDIANDSVNQTLARSLYTSLTVIITLLALYFLGGVTTREFVLAMLIGIISGTYSSIFNASCLLVWWREFKSKQKTAAKPATA
ncbi:MAG: protein translocase subunit SecF [Candidatus Obscuribacterales bacterium]|nr:protein translocase subunit SecF [Candidatus Obscuribacterales bacterium]